MAEMDIVGVKFPKEQKELLDEIAEKRGYPNKSEYIRELVRKDMESYMVLREEVAEEIRERKEELEKGEIDKEDLETTEEVFKGIKV